VLSDRCLSCPICPVCDVDILWPNGWMDQDETWRAVRHRPWPHCVRRGPSSTPQWGTVPQFSAHVCCGQMAGWIKMPLGMEVDLGPGDFALDREIAALPIKLPLGTEVGLSLSDFVLDGDPAPAFQKGGEAASSIFGPCLLRPNGWMDQYATWYVGRRRPKRHCVTWQWDAKQFHCKQPENLC